jgi:hypothetical protein
MEVIFSDQNFSCVCDILQSCLREESNDGRLMLQAMRTLNCIFASVRSDSELDSFQSLIVPIFQGLEASIDSITAGRIRPASDYPTFGTIALDEAYAQILVELAGFNSSFFATRLHLYFEPYITLLSNPNLRKEVRGYMLEFLVTLCENSPKVVRKFKNSSGVKGYFIERVLPICINMFLTCSEKSFETWASDDGDEDDEEGDESFIAGNAIFRISTSLGWLSTCHTLPTHTSALLQDQTSWAKSFVGLQILSGYFDVSSTISKSATRLSFVSVYR